MRSTRVTKIVLPLIAAAVAGTVILPATVGAETTKSSGKGRGIDVSWTEIDLEDAMGLPGNTHVGYLYIDNGPYGSYAFGTVSDFECEEGESPWGGGHFGEEFAEEVIGEGQDAVADAISDEVDAIIDDGGSMVNADVIVSAIGESLTEEVPDVIEEHPVFAPCDLIQERYLSAAEDLSITMAPIKGTARVVGSLIVSDAGGHGGHGNVIGNPPIDLFINGGEVNNWESSYSTRGNGYFYSNWSKGVSYYGGTVTGRIGPMNFADDADDESYGGFNAYDFRTVERVR